MLQIQKLKTTVLKASEKEANKIADTLLELKYKNSGNAIFKKEIIGNGWQLLTKMFDETGNKILSPVLIFTNNPAPKMQYDERVITIS